jgi:diguanylate cyclase (GGDEF)-like protein
VISDRKLTDESGRIAALNRYGILDTPRETIFDRIAGLVQKAFDVPIAAISLIDNNRQWFKSCIGLDVDETSRELSFCAHTIQAADPMFVSDATLDDRFARNPFVVGTPYIRSYMGVPLCTPDGYNIGSLCAIDVQPRIFTQDQIQLLSGLGSLVVEELELRCIAQVDSLTGAISRRSFILELKKELARANLRHLRSSLVLLDIDHFNELNEIHGHSVGDMVLRNLADRLRKLLRSKDAFGRIGGEEFALLLPETDAEAAFETTEQIRRAVADEPILLEPSVKITASFGISCPAVLELSPTDWLAAADLALYKAKCRGRNTCCIV